MSRRKIARHKPNQRSNQMLLSKFRQMHLFLFVMLANLTFKKTLDLNLRDVLWAEGA